MTKIIDKLNIKSTIKSPIYSSFILAIIFLSFWFYHRTEFLKSASNMINLSIIFEITLFVIFSILYFYMIKCNMKKQFIKDLSFRYSFLLFISLLTQLTFEQIFNTYQGIITSFFEKILGIFIATCLYIFPVFIISIITLFATNKLYELIINKTTIDLK